MNKKIIATNGMGMCISAKKELVNSTDTTNILIFDAEKEYQDLVGGERKGMGTYNVYSRHISDVDPLKISDPKLELMKEVETIVKRD